MFLSQVQAMKTILGGSMVGRSYEILADNNMRIRVTPPPKTTYKIKWDDTNEWVAVVRILPDSTKGNYKPILNIIPYEMIQDMIFHDLTEAEENAFLT